MKTRDVFVEELLRSRGMFTMGELAKEFPSMIYTLRNGVSECRARLAADGFEIKHFYGKTWGDNGYTLVRVDSLIGGDDKTVMMACLKCGHVFAARKRDVNEGKGRYCSRRCSGSKRGSKPSLAQNSEASQGQYALL